MPPETAPDTPQELAQPLAEPLPPVQLDALKAVAAGLDRAATQMDAQDIVAAALAGPWAGDIAVVSSFGAEAAVLLHMVARARHAAPVLFIDTRLLFPETLAYQQQLATYLGLQDVRILRVRHLDLAWQDSSGQLHRSDPDACCTLRKTAPLDAALAGFDGWITGRKRHQSGSRAALPHVETDGIRLKINPLTRWSAQQIATYLDTHALPRHPLVAQGYPSIGCAPCTSPVRPGEDPRAGRWRNREKEECGIHILDGRIVRSPATKAEPTGATR